MIFFPSTQSYLFAQVRGKVSVAPIRALDAVLRAICYSLPFASLGAEP